ncbi:hypothetical protein OCU04_004934 [Sclerotinia nivalis]|uniref:Uncharacterized protein n=1 Tax=Sclerotinia nivalis TaxID=352851 RepID=A0A9X0ARF5_9HELO|nr:hypothetical protein OCU04_004934 [Sclerotinia nivalis]
MTPEEVAELNWDTKLPLSLVGAVAALEKTAGGDSLSELEDFLQMYIEFKKLEAKQAAEMTEKERLDIFTATF